MGKGCTITLLAIGSKSFVSYRYDIHIEVTEDNISFLHDDPPYLLFIYTYMCLFIQVVTAEVSIK